VKHRKKFPKNDSACITKCNSGVLRAYESSLEAGPFAIVFLLGWCPRPLFWPLLGRMWGCRVQDRLAYSPARQQPHLRTAKKIGRSYLDHFSPKSKNGPAIRLMANLPGRVSLISLCRVSRVSGAVLWRNAQSAVAAGACCGVAGPWIAGLGDARCDWCLRAR
jgi:hypothetical protein